MVPRQRTQTYQAQLVPGVGDQAVEDARAGLNGIVVDDPGLAGAIVPAIGVAMGTMSGRMRQRNWYDFEFYFPSVVNLFQAHTHSCQGSPLASLVSAIPIKGAHQDWPRETVPEN